MAIPQSTVWTIDPHTYAKHKILRRYLAAWFPILASNNSRILYVDGFCGPGRYEGGEEGSPMIALKEAMNQYKFIRNSEVVFLFMDEDERRIDHLREEIRALNLPNNFQVHLESKQFAGHLNSILDDVSSRGSYLAPTFAFIDPFGWDGVPFTLVQRLLANPKTEAFINFMVDATNRFLTHPNAKIKQQISDFLGTDAYTDIAQTSQNRKADLRSLYQSQLETCASFVRYFEMRNENNRALYYLFFASRHRLGHVRMKEALWAVDPEAGTMFSDATNPAQSVLFTNNSPIQLADIILAKFKGQTLIVDVVKQFVEDHTAFTAKLMREAFAMMEADSRVIVQQIKDDGKSRRRNTYPENAILSFSQ